MRKMLFLLILLTGCLGTNKQMLDVKDGKASWTASKTTPWWRKNTAGMTKAQNPWEKFNQPKAQAKWHNPWAATNLQELGVTPIKPTKPLQYRILRPKTRVLIVPADQFEDFYNKYFKKGKMKKSPLQDKLFPPEKKKRRRGRKRKAY